MGQYLGHYNDPPKVSIIHLSCGCPASAFMALIGGKPICEFTITKHKERCSNAEHSLCLYSHCRSNKFKDEEILWKNSCSIWSWNFTLWALQVQRNQAFRNDQDSSIILSRESLVLNNIKMEKKEGGLTNVLRKVKHKPLSQILKFCIILPLNMFF